MKFSKTSILLLIACTFCLYHGANARVVAIPKSLEDIELPPVIEDIRPRLAVVDILPNVELPPIVEDEIYERVAIVDVQQPENRANECSVTVRGGITNPQPVFLKTNSEEFYPYNDIGQMKVNAGASLELFCPAKFTTFDATLKTATCVSGTVFKVDGTNYDFKEFICKSWPAFTAEKTGRTCNGGIVLRTGFKISSSRFAEQMQICFNEDEEVTRYVRHTLDPGSNYYQTGVDRLTFQTAGFFNGKSVDKLYTQATQQETINNELGGDASKYFDNSKNVYLARGHMAAKADFVYGSEQRGTFLFVNVAPQWQTFNAGNWARVEDGLRDWVSKNKMNVNCYTGVWSVTTLPNNKGVETPLYLAYDDNHNGLIPVPKLYFRVVIEPSTHRGIVFVGVNNPHLTLAQIKNDYILCNDVSDQVTYINWKKTDISAGYSYACEVEEFLKKVPYLPALTAKNGLLV